MSQKATELYEDIFSGSGSSDEPEMEDDWYDSLLLKKFDMLAYRVFGEYLSDDENAYSEYRKVINQARMDIVYDIYISRILLTSLIGGAVGFVLGSATTLALLSSGALTGVSVTLNAPSVIESFFQSYATQIASSLIVILFVSIIGGISGGVLYYIPKYRAGERGRRIDRTLPSSVTFMYALSRGGMNIIEVIEKTGDAEDVYGEVSNEFDMILRDMEYFGNDLRVALRNAGEMTPSENFKSFSDDLLSVIDSGGEITPFLYNKSQRYHEIRKQDQKGFLDTLALMAESYVVAFVAAPLFVIIIISIMSLMGGADLFVMYMIVYCAMPIATLGFVLAIDLISTGGDEGSERLKANRNEFSLDDLQENAEASDDEMVKKLAEGKKTKERKKYLKNPLSTMRESPVYSLTVTVPVAILFMIGAVGLGLASLSLEGFKQNPVGNTTYLWVVPLFISVIPLSYFHETKKRREKKVLSELPDTLRKVKSANETGMTLDQAFLLVSETSTGVLSKELKLVHNKVKWGSSLNEALVDFANRMRVPRLSRTVKLITKANESSGNLQEVLQVAARDADTAYKLDRERFQSMIIYTVIILLTFLVFLFVIFMLDRSFLSEMAAVGGPESSGGRATDKSAFSPEDIPIDTYRMIFFHASIIQAFFSGLVAGQMGENDLLSGLKYGVLMTMVSLVVFVFI